MTVRLISSTFIFLSSGQIVMTHPIIDTTNTEERNFSFNSFNSIPNISIETHTEHQLGLELLWPLYIGCFI